MCQKIEEGGGKKSKHAVLAILLDKSFKWLITDK